MADAVQYFLLGSSFMFSALIAWIFWRKGNDMLSRLVTALMIVMAVGFLKDTFMMLISPPHDTSITLRVSTVADVVAVPIYAFILVELCSPGRLTLKSVCLFEAPFILLPLLLVIFRHPVFYYTDMAFAILLGLTTATWSCFAIPRYHKYLKANFSYDDDINLYWLQSILWTFFIILTVWTLSCITYNPWLDVMYMLFTLTLWIFICYFIYKHKSVVDELRPIVKTEPLADKPAGIRGEIFARIRKLIEEDRIYLNPMLKLSDLAQMANTNRTYASAYFSAEAGSTFYDHINGLRVSHAKTLLAGTAKRIDKIAEESGFNSRQSFHRVFITFAGMTPAEYRTSARKADID